MYGKILLPIDDLQTAAHAITNAKNIAVSSGADIILPHVVTPENLLLTQDEHLAGLHAAAEVVEIARNHEAGHVEQQKELLQGVVANLSHDGVNALGQAVAGNAHREIVRVVEEQGIDLVIISAHGRRGVSRALPGSVADEVIHDIGVPVMVVRRS